RRGKKTYPVLAALAAGGAPARELAALLDDAPGDEEAVRRAARLVEAAGGRDAAETLAGRHLSAALATMDATLPDTPPLRPVCAPLLGRTRCPLPPLPAAATASPAAPCGCHRQSRRSLRLSPRVASLPAAVAAGRAAPCGCHRRRGRPAAVAAGR